MHECLRMTRHRALPSPFDRQPFRVGSALDAGVGEGRLRGRDLARPFHGVRVPASITQVDAARAYTARMTEDQHFSHWTAAVVHGLPLPTRTQLVHVTSLAPARASRAKGVVGHSSIASQTTTVRGLRVSTPVGTWVDMGTELSIRNLVIMGDALVRRKRPVATMAALEAAVLAHRGRPGAARLAAALLRVRPRTDSVRETTLRLDIVDFGLPEPEVNVEIHDSTGRLIAIADLCYREFRVIPEYDGEQHRTDRDQFFRDVDRLDDLAEERYRVIRFNRSHISVHRLNKLRRALLSAGWRPPPVANRSRRALGSGTGSGL